VKLPHLGVVTDEAFLAVYTGIRPKALRIARYRGAGDTAEDIVQTVAANLWSQRDTLPGITAALFMCAVKRSTINLYRTRRARPVVLVDPEYARDLADAPA
jgi:DNA-directed RNA polymerase specialized sigma24 family protein